MNYKVFVLVLIFCINIYNIYGQTGNISKNTYYKNGVLKTKGKTFRYDVNSNSILGCSQFVFEKKIGKWKYFYPDGNLCRIEKYKKIIDCNNKNYPDGVWKYWSDNGVMYNKEVYVNGELFQNEKEVFKDTILIEKRLYKKGFVDTTIVFEESINNNNLVSNNEFDLYYFKPVSITHFGNSRIEDIIPDWYNSNISSPDYYNQYRKIYKVENNLFKGNDETNRYSYIGTILYHPTNKYSEYIQTQLKTVLKKDELYCIEIQICLSQNSGYTIDKFGVYFSNEKIFMDQTDNFSKYNPQIIFNKEISNIEWSKISKTYRATGNEYYLTIGRFLDLEDIDMKKVLPSRRTGLDINYSAYYLFDYVNLYPIKTESECSCDSSVNEINEKMDKSDTIIDFENIKKGEAIILQNILFEIDEAELLPVSFVELNRLVFYLKDNNLIKLEISGHTDNTGTVEYNVQLSELRAKAVADYILEKGIEADRISYRGYGNSKPIASNETEVDKTKNRRVEFKLLKE